MSDQFPVQSRHRYVSVETLSDPQQILTCSMDVARRWGKAERIMPCASFEEGAADVKAGVVAALLVPAAYPRIGNLIMDRELKAAETFIMPIAPLLLVGASLSPPASADVIFHHPATEPLLPEVAVPFCRAHPVGSNPEACQAVLAFDGPALAITNGLSAAHYRLPVYATLRPSIGMPFICFVRPEWLAPPGCAGLPTEGSP